VETAYLNFWEVFVMLYMLSSCVLLVTAWDCYSSFIVEDRLLTLNLIS